MSQRAQRFIEAAKKPMPEGTYAVGAGLLISGVATYGFQILSFLALNKSAYAALGGLWVVVFIIAPGFFLPLEQEVGRALADRRARGVGGGPLVKRAALMGGLLAIALIILTFIASQPIIDSLFHGETALLFCFVIALVCYGFQMITRGTLAGNGRFGPYGMILAAEGIIRLVPCLLLYAAGVDQPVYYGLCLAIPPAVAAVIALRGQHGLLKPGPDAPWSEMSTRLGFLLTGSVLAQLLSYAAALGVVLLATTKPERTLAGDFIIGFFLARIPILLFQAVQAALLPKLAGLAGSGRREDFRAALAKLVLIVCGIGVIGVVTGYILGPWAGHLLFGDKFNLSSGDLALLAAGSGAFILALTLAQALIALLGHARAVVAWVIGLVGFVVVTALGKELFFRVELGYLIGSSLAAIAMGALLMDQMRRIRPDSLDLLVEQIEHEPLEI
jgi:O-antigen/teichoic acid export membrane protein